MSAAVLRVVEHRRSGFALAGFLGFVVATGQAPLGWAWLSLGALATAIAFLTLPRRWQVAAWRGWAIGTAYFAGTLFWIVEPFMVDIGRHGWMAPFALFFLAGGLALFWALAFGLAARLGRNQRWRALWLVVTWSAVEILRSFIFTGFPWALIGHIWIDNPQMQVASIVGAHGLTVMTLAAAVFPAVMGAQKAAIGGVASVAIGLLAGGYGTLRVPAGPAAIAEPPIAIRLIQPNAAQHEKWLPEMIPVFYQRQLDLTSVAPDAGMPRPDVVIWPETAIPWLLEHSMAAFAEMAEAGQGAQILVGVQSRGPEGEWFNSLALIDAAGMLAASYDKHHLVPFGEYMPMMRIFARLGIFGLAANSTGGYTPGPGPFLIDLGAAGQVLPLICYEAIFPNDIARAPGRADWLVQVTNDAWFGELAGPWQHLALAQLRAVEQGVPMMRAANTGISAAIDPYGRVTAQLPLGQSGKIDAMLPAALTSTPYSKFGDNSVFATLAMLTLVFAWLGRRNKPIDRAPTGA